MIKGTAARQPLHGRDWIPRRNFSVSHSANALASSTLLLCTQNNRHDHCVQEMLTVVGFCATQPQEEWNPHVPRLHARRNTPKPETRTPPWAPRGGVDMYSNRADPER